VDSIENAIIIKSSPKEGQATFQDFGGLLYHCQYVLIETPAAFLWVDFTATQTTFEANKEKFEVFMGGFEILR